MKYLAFLAAALFVAATATAQTNSYRSLQNPLYWKNRMPDAAYWQQDVHYTIDARMDEGDNRIDAGEQLEYWNNSPDTLYYVFFHLYQNAFVKGSYQHKLEEELGEKAKLGKHEAAGEGTLVSNMKVDGMPAEMVVDNSIMKVLLPKPLLPGGKITLAMDFKTWYDDGSTRRRMQMWDAWGFKHYNGCQWFPKISVYDRKFGWDTYQHLNKEFYGDFGSYDVSLNFPSNYVLEATGAIQNRAEVLPDALRAKLDVKNFKDKKWDEAPSIITPYVKGERKTWKYHADNVHDFAFTADPSYRISTDYWNGIECVGLVQEPHASGWQTTGTYVASIVKLYSEDFGMYQYPKMVAADARDGMEYPMLTLDGDREPSYHKLLTHEVGHNWFYGMVGNNETYRAALDEGFTQFLTGWSMGKLHGNNLLYGNDNNWYRKHFTFPSTEMEGQVINGYQRDAMNHDELPLNTHSNDFHDALGHDGGYRQVYFKTATMLYNLQYTLGDSLFQKSMQHYFSQWRFCHPYFEDFRASIIQYTHNDLNWFFDEWLETTKTVDYSITGIKHTSGKDNYTVSLRRRNASQMPIDLTITARDGKSYNYYIPNTWYPKETDATVLPKWYGWSKIQPRYEAHVNIPSGIKEVQIDTTYRLADVYYPDNYRKPGLFGALAGVSTRIEPFGMVAPVVERRKYHLYLRPDVWYNPIDGVKAGIHADGNYMGLFKKLDITVWANTHWGQDNRYASFKSEGYYTRYAPVNYNFSYASPLMRSTPKLLLQLNSRFLDGLWLHRAGLQYKADDHNTIKFYGQSMWRPDSLALDYLLAPGEWSSIGASHLNNSVNLAWTHSYNYAKGSGAYTFSLRAPALTGNSANAYNYGYAQLEAINTNRIGKLELRTRLFARYGTGTQLPYESLLFTAGANPEELMEDKYTRTIGFVPDDEDWRGYTQYQPTHFQQGGGLNLRGYAGYFLADERNGQTLVSYKARSGAAFNAELDFDGLFRLHPKLTRNWLHLDAYLFGDAGLAELSSYSGTDFTTIQPTTMWSNLRADAGVGFAATIKNWGPFQRAHPLTLRIDFPVLLNRPAYADPRYAAFRYVIGINRSF